MERSEMTMTTGESALLAFIEQAAEQNAADVSMIS
jgi:hypothetical protein